MRERMMYCTTGIYQVYTVQYILITGTYPTRITVHFSVDSTCRVILYLMIQVFCSLWSCHKCYAETSEDTQIISIRILVDVFDRPILRIFLHFFPLMSFAKEIILEHGVVNALFSFLC